MRIYLASQSPRRRALLAQAGIDFDTIFFRQGARRDPETDESVLAGEAAEDYVLRVAMAKAELGNRLVHLRRLLSRPVLAADTIIEIDGDIIGKPESDEQAFSILKRLSGREHRVLTGVAVRWDEHAEYALSTSNVLFRDLADSEIRQYVLSGEHRDKAGAYGIQGRAALFVEHIRGDYNGIMGLPLCLTGQLLKQFCHARK